MIPVRIAADAKPVLASERRFGPPESGHWLADAYCPVCDKSMAEGTSVLVFVGIMPEDRKDAGYTTGAAVAVHEACAVPS